MSEHTPTPWEVREALVGALRTLYKHSFHSKRCWNQDDENAPCNCGAAEARMEARAALKVAFADREGFTP